jgi:hypothetical protein
LDNVLIGVMSHVVLKTMSERAREVGSKQAQEASAGRLLKERKQARQ